MKRALVFLTLVAPVIGNAQISTLRHSWPLDRQIQDVVACLKGFVLFGYPDGLIHHGPLVTRTEYAVATRQVLGLAESRIESGKPFAWYEKSAWMDSFWMFKWLGKTLSSELIEIGVGLNEYDARVEKIKQRLVKVGIMVDDPYARFSDVPKGHWADEAIHNMRELGILRGYPDNTFRG
jgi:hypothetical protein